MAEATSTEPKLSRVGKRPVAVPKGVTVTLKDQQVDIQGPKGKLSRVMPEQTEITRAELERELDLVDRFEQAQRADAERKRMRAAGGEP